MTKTSPSKLKAPWWSALVERIRGYHPAADKALLAKLQQWVTAPPEPNNCPRLPLHPLPLCSNNTQKGHGIDTLKAEPPLLLCPAEIANVLVDLRMDPASIAAGMLLEGMTSHRFSLEEVRRAFGDDVAFLMEGVAKISLVSSRAKSASQAEEFRKMILAMARDIRVVLIRLSIYLQQMRSLDLARIAPPARIPREILEIYAPITHRLGIYWLKNELEDLAFKLDNPEKYHALCQQVALYRKGGQEGVRKMVALLSKLLRKYGITGTVLGREKHIYSIHAKLQRKGGNLESLYDMVGYRIIVRKKNDCYRVLGMIHGEFRPIPGRLKDYIALPKSNGYQSLHSVVFGPFGYRAEIQIRTEKMHQIAESGVAAHWTYKAGLNTKKHSGATGYKWLKRMLEKHQNAEDPNQFLENFKIDLFPNEIYLFSPKGDIITLPVGATPVDFAYGVHSEVGDHCQGAKVNGRMVALKTPLSTGDVVEIITSRKQHPSVDWLRFVVTSQARYRINRWEKERNRKQAIALGRELLGREILKTCHGVRLTESLLHQATERLKLPSPDELLYQLGSSTLSPLHVLYKLFPDLIKNSHDHRASTNKSRSTTSASPKETESRPSASLRFDGLLAEMAVVAARCCSPIPGDATVGIVTTGKGITLHSQVCPNLTGLKQAPERWIETVDWPEQSSQHYVARLRIWANNHPSTSGNIDRALAGVGATVRKKQIQARDRDPYLILLDVEVTGIHALQGVIQTLRATACVTGVERVLG